MLATGMLALMAGAAAAADAPAVQAAITQKGVDYALGVGLPMLRARLADLSIPDVPFDKDSFKGSVSNIKCNNADIGNVTLAIQENAGVALNIPGLGISCNAQWSYKFKHWPHVPKGDGSVDISITDSSAGMVIALSDVSGKPHVQAGACSASIHIDHLHFHGGLSGAILNLLSDLLHDHIQKWTDKSVCDAVTKTVNDDVDTKLSQYNMTIPLRVQAPYNVAEVDFALLSTKTGSGFVGVDLHGEVYRIGNHTEAAVPPPELPPLTSALDSHMVELAVAPFLLETAAYVFWQSGLVTFHVDSGSIPPSVPFKLDTSTFEEWAPAMYQQYPNAPMALAIDLVGQVDAQVAPSVANMSAPLALTFKVLANGTTIDAFQVTCPFSGGLFASVNETAGTLMPRITYLACPVSLAWSKVGTVHADLIKAFVDAILGSVGVDLANKDLAKGIPLPTFDGISFTNAAVNFGIGSIQILSDVTYTPPPPAEEEEEEEEALLRIPALRGDSFRVRG